MSTLLASRIDALSDWRTAVGERLGELDGLLARSELADAASRAAIASLRERLADDRLVIAFVAEFSRGKSELINALFFAAGGGRLLPAAPGRTTMCPVEIGWNAAEPPALALLPMESRLTGETLAELTGRCSAWTRIPLEACGADELAGALLEVMRTRRMAPAAAAALGLWDEDRPADSPPLDADGQVEVPVWRHALLNYRHPLLERGLVVIDTPGLNALGAEPGLTLGLLPRAHATVFMLAADTGVTRSDLQVWRDHLGAPDPGGGGAATRFAVLNKIDMLRDPLLAASEVELQLEMQCLDAARLLGLPAGRVFPLSAREALVARVSGDAAALERSRLPALEAALGEQLLLQRQALLAAVADEGLQRLQAQAVRRIGERRRQAAEQLLELRGLRGKSGSRLDAMLQRLTAETAEFELCHARLRALRLVHARMLAETTQALSAELLQQEGLRLQEQLRAARLGLGARKAFGETCRRLAASMDTAQRRVEELQAMLGAAFAQLNAEFGFGLALAPPPDLDAGRRELQAIEAGHARYAGLRHALRLADPAFGEQLRRMLMARLQAVFEGAEADIRAWNRTASSQIDRQLRARRGGFRQRRDALERVQAASGELERRIDELETQEAGLLQLQQLVAAQVESVRRMLHDEPPSPAPSPSPAPAAAALAPAPVPLPAVMADRAQA